MTGNGEKITVVVGLQWGGFQWGRMGAIAEPGKAGHEASCPYGGRTHLN